MVWAFNTAILFNSWSDILWVKVEELYKWNNISYMLVKIGMEIFEKVKAFFDECY